MRPAAVIVLAAALSLVGCSRAVGLVRFAPLESTVDFTCVERALANVDAIDNVSRVSCREDINTILPFADFTDFTSFRFHVAGRAEETGALGFMQPEQGAGQVRLGFGMGATAAATTLTQAHVDRWRPILDDIQAQVGAACALPELLAPITEVCRLDHSGSGDSSCAPA